MEGCAEGLKHREIKWWRKRERLRDRDIERQTDRQTNRDRESGIQIDRDGRHRKNL